MKKRLSILTFLILGLSLMFAGSVLAFSDIKGDPGEAAITALKESGVISGITSDLFMPQGKVTYAQAAHMLVKGFDLSIDPIRFIKEPKASDYFTRVPNDAWYAQSFVIAHLNGIPIPKEADPNKELTREEFAHLLFQAVLSKGDFAFIELYVQLNDEQEVSPERMESVQKLLIANIATLDDGYFYPKREITRSEAAQMLHKAILFVSDAEPIPPTEPPFTDEVTMSVSQVNEEVSKVTVSWGEKPNPGYRVSITRIEFSEDGNAYISYALHEPEEGKMYPQVITIAKADTFISSQYRPVLKERAAADCSDGPLDGDGSNPNVPVSSPADISDSTGER